MIKIIKKSKKQKNTLLEVTIKKDIQWGLYGSKNKTGKPANC